jgi:hypothetical protein
LATALGIAGIGAVAGYPLLPNQIPTSITLTLAEGVCVSHIELVMRSEALVNLQLPNFVSTASTELVQPFIQEDFELDPNVGWVERASIFEIPGIGGRLGSVWLVADVGEMRTAQGVVWNVTGSCRLVQPNEVLACVSLEDALTIGIFDPGLSTRGPEATGAGAPSGIPTNTTDESIAAARRGSSQRYGGGAAPNTAPTITLTPDPDDF